MSDTSDFKKLNLDEQTAEDEGSFATWLPPILSADPRPVRPPATLTGLGPPSGPRASTSAAPDETELGWEEAAAEGNLAPTRVQAKPEEPIYAEPVDFDDDDAPTRVISQLFPNLGSKARSAPTAAAPDVPAAAAARAVEAAHVEMAPVEDAVTVIEPDEAFVDAVPESGSNESLTQAGQTKVAGAAALAAEGQSADAGRVTSEPVRGELPTEAPPQVMAHAQTQESELLSLMMENLAKRRSSPSVRYAASPILRETEADEPPVSSVEFIEGQLSLAPPEVPTGRDTSASARPVPVYPPTVEIAQYERELPTAPSSRRPTPPSELDLEAASVPHVSSTRSEPPWAATVGPKPPIAPRVALRYAIFAFAASALVTVLALRAILPGKGTVLVTAIGASGMPVENAQVLVDGTVACTPVPCRVSKLREGRHLVTVKAPGYQPIADRAISVDPDAEALVHFALTPELTAGIHVRVDARGLRVLLDGEDRGEAPLTLAGLAPGEHTIRLAGSPLYAAFEQKVTLRPNSTLTFSPNLVALQAFINITAGSGAESASVEVIGGPQRKAVVELPARIEVPPLGTYRVRATRGGYHDFESSVRFGNGEAEKQVHIDLSPVTAPASAPVPARPATVPVVLEESPAAPKPAAVSTAVTNGSLDVSSVPSSNVIVDGRPMGATPQKLALSPGSHTVVFVHPTQGRKTVTVKVEPGKTAVAATRF